MAKELDPCCQEALNKWLQTIAKTVVSYPLIQDRPCPKCKKIIPIRVYEKPEAA